MMFLSITLGLWLELSRGEWSVLVITIGFVLSAEAFNTALEELCNMVRPETHAQVKIIKDVAAAAVLVSAISAVIIGIYLFGPKLYALVI